MDAEKLHQLLVRVQEGKVTPAQAMESMRGLPFEDLGFARLDTHRAIRKGFPEVVFCQNKTPEQATAILERLWEHHDRIMATRATSEIAATIRTRLPEARYDSTSRLITLTRTNLPDIQENAPYAVVVSGGTADLPVAEEAAQVLEFLGHRTERAYDVGVSGLHRLLDHHDLLLNASTVISVAGMEGALTSVVGGLVSCPVIGVPTSVGYGASFSGLAALLSMLNSCAPGVTVVNIDNGFGAAQFAHLILRIIQEKQTR